MLSRIRRLDELELAGLRVLIRADLNCPLTGDLQVADDSRIAAALPTIRAARQRGAKVIVCSHLGRPKGRARKELTLRPVGERLAELLGCEIFFPDDCVGDGPRKLATNLRDGQVLLLENLRFHSGETKNDDGFARALASLCQVYVNDAFGAVHRAHASTVGVPRLVKDRGAGLLLVRETETLGALARAPERPFVVAVGGAKVKGKTGVLENLLGVCDTILVGGAMAHTFMAALGLCTGASQVEEDRIPLAKRVLTKAEARGVEILLPRDLVCAPEASEAAPTSVHPVDGVPDGHLALDIGPETVALFRDRVAHARTVLWTGPMGVCEIPAFATGTTEMALAVSDTAATSVVSGGDTVVAVHQAGVTPFINHISTGGGASLELLEGKELPGLEALRMSVRKTIDV